jgi:hypothetical protein
MSGSILQAGPVTRGHVAAWGRDGVLLDGGDLSGDVATALADAQAAESAAQAAQAAASAAQNPTATGGVTPASLSNRFGRRLNVVDDFGAKGDGVTDDYAAIQAAFNQVGRTGGTVYFPAPATPEGFFAISQSITVMAQVALPAPLAGSDIHFSTINVMNVESDAKATIKATSAMASMLNFQFDAALSDIGPFYSTVHGITLDGNGLAAIGILSNFTMHMDIQHNAVWGCTGPCIEIIGYGVARVAHNTLKGPICVQLGTTAVPGGGDALFQKNDMYPDNGSGTCQAILMGPWSGDTTIYSNTITARTDGLGTCYGVYLAGDQAPDAGHEIRHVVIDANEFWGVNAAVLGRSFGGGRNVWQNIISQNHVYHTYGVLADLNTCDDFLITDNFCNGVQLGVVAGPAITLNACSRIRVSGNDAAEYTNSFLVATDIVDCEIVGNTVQDAGRGGTGFTVVNLFASSSCVRNVFRGNHFVQTSSAYAQNGIFEHAGVDFTVADGSNFMSGILTPYTKAGANSVMGQMQAGDLYASTGLFNGASVSNSIPFFGVFRNNSAGPYHDLIHQRNSGGNPAALVSGDVLGANRFFGFDGTANQIGVQVQAVADGAPSAGSMPGRYSVYTTPAGSVTPVERFRVSQDGTVSANINSPIATDATGGFLAIPVCAGPPTGTPAHASGASIVFDSVNTKLWAWNGSAWKGVVLT